MEIGQKGRLASLEALRPVLEAAELAVPNRLGGGDVFDDPHHIQTNITKGRVPQAESPLTSLKAAC